MNYPFLTELLTTPQMEKLTSNLDLYWDLLVCFVFSFGWGKGKVATGLNWINRDGMVWKFSKVIETFFKCSFFHFLLTWFSVVVTVILVHPIPDHSGISHSTVPDPIRWVPIRVTPDYRSRGVVGGTVGRSQQSLVMSSFGVEPRHSLVQRVPPWILPAAEFPC